MFKLKPFKKFVVLIKLFNWYTKLRKVHKKSPNGNFDIKEGLSKN